MRDLFELVVNGTQASPSFMQLRSDPIYGTTRALMNRLFSELPKPDGNFVEDFQTTGFESRVWELYLFALGEDGIWSVDRPCEVPDYHFSRFGEKVWLEAVIAGPAQRLRDPSEQGDFQKFVDNGLAFRFGTPLKRKLEHGYGDLSHVKGRSFVIAIADFAQTHPVPWTEHGLRRYLYGHDYIMTSDVGRPLEGRTTQIAAHHYDSKTIPSSFFGLPGAEHISAVVFSNSGTVDKFHRKAFDATRDRSYRLLRRGLCPDPRPESHLPQPFAYVVGEVDESWSEGLVAFHNPNALRPISRLFFQGIAQWWFRNGEFEVQAPEFHPLNSITDVFEPVDADAGDDFVARLNIFADDWVERTQMTDEDVAIMYERHRIRQAAQRTAGEGTG